MVRGIPISTAPAVDPAIIERNALGLSFFFSGCAVAIVRFVRGKLAQDSVLVLLIFPGKLVKLTNADAAFKFRGRWGASFI